MRVALSTLLAAVVASALALAGCSASTDDTTTNDDAEIISATNPMGLRLAYDDPTSRVTATVKTRPRSGERLVMRIRRGRLSAVDAQVPLDCTQLADAPAIARPAYATLTSTSAMVFQGPEMDRSLLASVYSQQWIDAHIAPDMMERLSREGADAIVEACIVTAESVRLRLQTSIQDVWDASDPNAAPAIRARNSPPARL